MKEKLRINIKKSSQKCDFLLKLLLCSVKCSGVVKCKIYSWMHLKYNVTAVQRFSIILCSNTAWSPSTRVTSFLLGSVVENDVLSTQFRFETLVLCRVLVTFLLWWWTLWRSGVPCPYCEDSTAWNRKVNYHLEFTDLKNRWADWVEREI